MPGHRRAHYRGGYQREAAAVRAAAYGDPATRCWRCGLTLDEARQLHGKRITWDAGHLRAGEVGGPLAAECSRCNRSAGAREGNAARMPRSRVWSI